MEIITTTQTEKDMLRIANDNKHLLKENEVVTVKNNYGQRKYKKIDNELKRI